MSIAEKLAAEADISLPEAEDAIAAINKAQEFSCDTEPRIQTLLAQQPTLLEGDELEESFYQQNPEDRGITSDQQADESMRILRHWRREETRLMELHEYQLVAAIRRCGILEMIQKLDAVTMPRIQRARNRQRWHELALESFLRAIGKQKLQLTWGRLGWRAQPPSLQVTDESAALAWAEADPERAACVKRHFMVCEAKKLFKQDGELPPGTELVRKEPAFVAKTIE